MQPFFSRDDIALHRTVFPGAFNIAVLLSDLGDPDFRCDVFGWRFGMMMSRGYYLTGSNVTEDTSLLPVGQPASPSNEPESVRTGHTNLGELDLEDSPKDELGREPRSLCGKKVP